MLDLSNRSLSVRRHVAAVVVLAMIAAACGDSQTSVTGGRNDVGPDLMGGGALGGTASTELLAQMADVEVPDGDVAWVAHEVRLAAGESVEHAHSFAFVWAAEGSQTVAISGQVTEISQGGALGIAAGVEHTHTGGDGLVFWEIRLAPPVAGPPPDVPDATLVFASELLEGIPSRPTASFVEVVIPPQGGETSVHTHPGPELIYQLTGNIVYENEIIGDIELGPGGLEAIPPDTAVQKRNPSDEEATFLSWFLLDPSQEFATGANFGATEIEGTNVALIDNGGSVVAVSSNFNGGDNDSNFGASNVIDGDPATEWSSDGDGDEAFIEVGFDRIYDIHTVTVQTRTMGDTAEIQEFRLVDSDGNEIGTFELPGPNRLVPYEVEVTTDVLRLEVVTSSGGNTGLVELGAYADTG